MTVRKRILSWDLDARRAKCFTGVKRAITLIGRYLDASYWERARLQLNILERLLNEAIREGWLADKEDLWGPFMTRRAAANWLGVSSDTIKHHESYGRFRTIKLESGTVLIDVRSFNRWMKSREVRVPPILKEGAA